MAKKVFQVIDHCTIYFLIAGTYTPVTLAGLRPEHPVVAFVIFGVVWAACFVAATLTAIDLEKYQKLSMVCYLAMGWCYCCFYIGYCIEKKKYIHSVFHLFVLAGSILHFFMILFYVIMR